MKTLIISLLMSEHDGLYVNDWLLAAGGLLLLLLFLYLFSKIIGRVNKNSIKRLENTLEKSKTKRTVVKMGFLSYMVAVPSSISKEVLPAEMNSNSWLVLGAIIAFLLLAFLIVVLIKPEKF